MDSDFLPNTEIQSIPNTQDLGKSKNSYAWVILFEFNKDKNNPFRAVPLRDFLKCEFPWKSIEGVMNNEQRIRLVEFAIFPGKQFYIFGKIQYGKKIPS